MAAYYPLIMALRILFLLMTIACPPLTLASTEVVLSDATIIDPAFAGRQRTHRDVLIVNDKIVAICAHGARKFPKGARVFHLSGKYVLPGFVDMHVHSRLNPRAEDGSILPYPSTETTQALMHALLAFGVTTIRDAGGSTLDVLQLRGDLQQGRIVGPTMYTAGQILNTSAPGSEFVRVTNSDDVCAEIDKQHKAGVDFIKIYSGLNAALTATAIQCAHRAGLPIIGHLQQTTWTEAANSGIDGIEHSAPWSPRYLPEKSRRNYDGSLFSLLKW